MEVRRESVAEIEQSIYVSEAVDSGADYYGWVCSPDIIILNIALHIGSLRYPEPFGGYNK